MRSSTLLAPLALALTLGACGVESAPVASTSTTVPSAVPTTAPEEATGAAADEVAHDEWLFGGPMATSLPTRTCVMHEPTDVELAAVDPEDPFAATDLYSTSCFDPNQYETAPTCTPPAHLPEDGAYYCGVYLPLTQRVVDDWNSFADAEDTASARQLGMTLKEYRVAYPDLPP